jgi:hypothetical protein
VPVNAPPVIVKSMPPVTGPLDGCNDDIKISSDADKYRNVELSFEGLSMLSATNKIWN